MSDPSKPRAIHQTPSNDHDVSSDCVFCTIATSFQPIDPADTSNKEWNPDKLEPPGYVLLATEHVIAFLDIAPLTRGHILVAPRKHRTKMGDLKPSEMAEIGSTLPLLARSVIKSVLPDIPHDEADYNIVQNNGPGAAQVIPHVHFHIIPRPPLNYQPPSKPKPTSPSKYPPSQLPTGIQASYVQFGRGRRHELDDDEAADLVQTIRLHVRDEWTREFDHTGKVPSNPNDTTSPIEHFTGNIEDAAWIEGSGGLVRNLQRRGGRMSEKL